MNIYIRELKANLKSLIIWCVSIIAIIVMGMAKYEGMKGSSQTLNEIIKNMPQSLQMLFGGGAFNLDTVIGFYAVVYLYIMLLGSIHATMLGSHIISKEERDKTYEFLLSKPVSRRKIIIAKFLAGVTNVLIFNLTILLSSIVIITSYKESGNVMQEVFSLTIGLFVLQLLFFVTGTALASFRNFPKVASSIAMAIQLTLFMMLIMVKMYEQLNFMKYLTPFHYFDAKTILIDEGFNVIYVSISLILIGCLSLLTFRWYEKRDLGC